MALTVDACLQAVPGSPAYEHVDLLTVVTHELGHVLGFASIEPGILGHDLDDRHPGHGGPALPRCGWSERPPIGVGAHTLTAKYQVPADATRAIGSTSHGVATSPVSPSDPAPLGEPAPFVQRLESDQAETASTGLDVIPAPVALDLVDASLLDPVLVALLDGRRRGSQLSNLRREVGNRPKLQRTLPALTPERVDAVLQDVGRHAVLQSTEKKLRFGG